MRRRVLVTGFGAFPGAPANPTASLLRRLARHRSRFARLGIDVRTLELPVIYAEIGPRLASASAGFRPDAIVHLGLASRRRHLSVETRAWNRAGPLHPDASGACPAAQRLSPGAPLVRRATWPSARIAAALRRAGFDARLSIDAGDYVCNATLYASLASGDAEHIGFLHVPRVRKRAARSSSRPSLEQLTQAALAAIVETVRASSVAEANTRQGTDSRRR